MRFALAIKRLTAVKSSFLAALISLPCFLLSPLGAQAKIEIGSLGAQSTMAEQGAICASFAALMENQLLINEDLGNLWSERRKFSGAVIRRAVELSGNDSPNESAIDALINDYREWLILNLSAQDPQMSSTDYQSDVQAMVRTNCKSLFLQADKAIIKRFPELAYLIDKTKIPEEETKQIASLIEKNSELNVQIIALRAEISALKAQAEAIAAAQAKTEPQVPESAVASTAPIAAPKPRPTVAPQRPKPVTLVQTTGDNSSANKPAGNLFFAQLGSFSSQSLANSAVENFAQTHPDLFTSIALAIEPHQFASGKTFFRVKTAVASRTAITKICDKLWDARLGCLIKTNID